MKSKTFGPLGIAFFLSVASSSQLIAADFYIAPKGSDLNRGTKARPWATLEAARDAVRKLRKEKHGPQGGITIWLRAGDYFRTNALELTEIDSGTSDSPVIWRRYKGETVRLIGGKRITGFHAVTNSLILERLPESARGHVFEADLRKLGISEFGKMKSRGFGRPIAPAHCELFFDGKPMTLARWPNEGSFEQIAGSPEASKHKDEHGGTLGKLEDGFFYNGDRPRQWQDLSVLWVHGYWAWDWANSYERVASLDPRLRLIKTSPPHGLYGFRKGQRFYFLNVLEELDQPGEWFLDADYGMIYFWPPRALGDDTEVLLSLLEQPLVKLTGVSDVTVRGLILEATRGNAVEIQGGRSNRIAGCVIRNIGNAGVTIVDGFGHGVQGCDVFDTGDGGVSLKGGDRQTLTSGGHFVENCHFARQGRWSKCYVPAVLLEGVGQRASHNLIHEHPHCAILFGGNDHLIEFNEIHHIALETGDVGAVYAGRDYTFRGNRIRNNFIHHTGGVGMGSMGIYMDDCVSGTEIFGNIFYKVQRAAFLGGGRDHQVINNIFVDCNHAVELDGRGLDKSPVWREMVSDTMRKSLAKVPLTLYREHYPEMKALDLYYGPPGGPAIEGADFKGVPPEENVVLRNVCVGKWLDVHWHATPSMLRIENNLTNAEDSFVKYPQAPVKAPNFVIKSDSPIWKFGFVQIPVEQIGLYRDELRDSLRPRTSPEAGWK